MKFEVEHIFATVVITYYIVSFKHISDIEFNILFTLFASSLFILLNKTWAEEWKIKVIDYIYENRTYAEHMCNSCHIISLLQKNLAAIAYAQYI
jgi:hypothetical protein